MTWTYALSLMACGFCGSPIARGELMVEGRRGQLKVCERCAEKCRVFPPEIPFSTRGKGLTVDTAAASLPVGDR